MKHKESLLKSLIGISEKSQALSLTGITVELDDLQACHRMGKKNRVIIKFKCRKEKHRVLSNRKTLQNKSLELTQLKFWENYL